MILERRRTRTYAARPAALPAPSGARVDTLEGGVATAGVGGDGSANCAQSTRIFELRTYEVPAGRFSDLNRRFREHTLVLFERHGIELVGAWRGLCDPKKPTLVYLVTFPSQEAAAAAWSRFQSDPDWLRVRQKSERKGALVERIEPVFLEPLQWSPLS